MMLNETMTARFGRVAVLYGGTSSERPVSLKSGQAVLAGLLRAGVNAYGIDVGADIINRLEETRPDRVFIALHGPGGEDGTLQGALEFLGLPYTGSGVMASAIAMDKLRCKQLWLGIGLPTAGYTLLDEDCNWEDVLAALGGSVMVKPSREGSSLGMTRASSAVELRAAWHEAARLDDSVIAEQWLTGAEYTVAILDKRALPVIGLQTSRGFYDYQAKYIADDTRYLCPCGLEAAKEEEIKDLALRAFASIDCCGWGRVDIMRDADGAFQLLEINTVPGMTDHSLVPMAARAAGIGFDELVVRILETSL